MESKRRILLIEDRDTDFKRVLNFFKKYEVDFFPGDDSEFQKLARLVITYARSNEKRKDEFLEKIEESIRTSNPDIIIIDLGLDGNEKTVERHGIDILKFINKKCDPVIRKFIISRHNDRGDIECDGYIQKGNVPIETQLEEKIIAPFNINKRKSQQPENPGKDSGKQEDNNAIEVLTKLEKYENFDYKFISPWISIILDKLITYVFYILIAVLFLLAPVDIYENAIKSVTSGEMIIDSFKIAERTFIAFLPFLITCSFYIFYTKSLRNYFFKSIIDPRVEDFESSSVLMKLSKKLFISSLLSYLFIKLIELLCFEKPETDKFFENFYGKSNPYLQLYFTSGLIVILILYYIYIDKNHKHKDVKKNDEENK